MPKIRSKTLNTLVALALVIAGGAGAITYYKNLPSEKAKAAEVVEVQKKVEEAPEAGIEAIDPETLKSVKESINTFPGFLVRAEIARQLSEKYITQKQHDQLIQLVDEKEKNQASSSSSSTSSVASSEK